jgi:hypothetical protein
MNSEILNELKMKTGETSIRNRFSSSGINEPDYLKLSNLDEIDIEKNTVNAVNDFNYPPPHPLILNELPEEISEDYNNDIEMLKKSINHKICCFGFSLILFICGLGALYKIYII